MYFVLEPIYAEALELNSELKNQEVKLDITVDPTKPYEIKTEQVKFSSSKVEILEPNKSKTTYQSEQTDKERALEQ